MAALSGLMALLDAELLDAGRAARINERIVHRERQDRYAREAQEKAAAKRGRRGRR
jgi:hypothetical protein